MLPVTSGHLRPGRLPLVYEEGKEEGRLREWEAVQALERGPHVQETTMVTATEETIRLSEDGVTELSHQVA